ncbi:hypothetical protein LTR36_008755 [Oleoguttula mirabilis]|uniref:H/ACA ribonucleoprotein complex non-core subunit NAF1 n=1 Tax=Oleoguttula mirabilis TaxID=1507867 RepID=A0AAV9JTN3_9PEZI|nr:hypothetical protein LTR36_008755 [Oleoguttula mirabilis]
MEPSLESREPDEARPAKRVKLDAPLDVTEDLQDDIVDDEDWGDIYGTSDPDPVAAAHPSATEQVLGSTSALPGEQDVPDLDEPDIDDPTSEVVERPSLGTLPHAPPGESVQLETADAKTKSEGEAEAEDGVPIEAIDHGEDLIMEQHAAPPPAADEASMRMVEETSGINGDPAARIEGIDGQTNGMGQFVQPVTNASSLITDGAATLGASSGEARPSAANIDTPGAQSQPAEDAGMNLLGSLEAANGGAEMSAVADEARPADVKPTEDAEFMAAAAAQKKEANPEWQFDPSDAESSSDDSDSDDTSDSDSDGGYELLDPATAAKILMAGEGDDDDGEGKKGKGGADHQPRTANEVKETVVPKPEVVITEDMKITELGHVEMLVENMVLIKGSTPGEYQVLESGSVLCNDKREVVGAVAETIGRVQEPMYSVAFTNAQEIENAGLSHGTKVYYVDSHSTFVFTQPLKNLKGTDASNIHDEEVAEEEMEFSDDEAEAEYKRQKKMAKKAGRGGFDGAQGTRGARGGGAPRSFGAPGHDGGATFAGNGHGDAPEQTYGGGMSYDDEPNEEFYSPLKRPDNLSQMMASGGPPKPQLSNDRGRGGRGRGGDRGRGDKGRGRGDRGRGRGGAHQDRDQRGGRGGFNPDREQRGGRGGFNQDREQRGGRGGSNQDRDQRGGRGGGRGGQPNGAHRGNAQSFPDHHNTERPNGGRQHSLPPKPNVAQASPPPPPPPTQQQYPAYTQYPQQPPQQAAAPQTYQFGGYTFQYGAAPPSAPTPQQQPQQSYYGQQQPAAAAPPAGAYVNPAFYQGQQQHQQQHQQQQHQPQQPQWTPQQTAQWPQQQQQAAAYGAWNGQQYTQPGAAASQAYTSAQQQQQNLADILRRMGGQQQQ